MRFVYLITILVFAVVSSASADPDSAPGLNSGSNSGFLNEPLELGVEFSEASDYATLDAARSASDVFGNSDEYLFWGGVGAAVVAVAAGVMGVLEHMDYGKANDAYTFGKERLAIARDTIAARCAKIGCDETQTLATFSQEGPAEYNGAIYSEDADGYRELLNPIGYLNYNNRQNKKAMDAHNINRILWWSGAALSAAGSITLFSW